VSESLSGTIGPINLDEKLSGKRSAGNLHAAFDEAGAGNVTKGVGLRTAAKAADNPPDPKVSAPALDPTDGCFLTRRRAYDDTRVIL
jgi:hypothetical protein